MKKIILKCSEIEYFIFDNILKLDCLNIHINTVEDLQELITAFHKMPTCAGGRNISMAPSNFLSNNFKKDHRFNVWRHVQCTYVGNVSRCRDEFFRCSLCRTIRKTISSFKFRVKQNPTKYRCPKKMEMKRKNESRDKSLKRLKHRFTILKNKLTAMQEKFIQVDEITAIEKIQNMKNVHPAQKLLITECIKQSKYLKKTSRRYTSEWLLLCLLLHIKSPTTYNFLRTNEILPLPSISTVRSYLSRVKLKCGLDEEFFEAFQRKMIQKNEFERHGIVIFDEMQVKQSVQLQVKSLKLMGVQDFGTDNPATAKSTSKLADHALVFMFSSLGSKLTQPIAVYAAKGATHGTCLAQLLLAVIKKLEKASAIIDGVVCDGATTNR